MLKVVALYSGTTTYILPAILLSLVLTIALFPSGAASAGEASSPGSFYAGKTVKILVGFRRGAAYDLYARLTARHLGRHIPGNPDFVVENSPETGSKTAERVYRDVAPDCATIAALIPALYLQQLTRSGEAGFDLAGFTWIGTPTKSHYLLYMRGTPRTKRCER